MSWRRTSSRGAKAGFLTRTRRFAVAGVLASGAALGLPALTTAASATTATGVCPTDIGSAVDCNVLITINADGSVTVTNPDNNNPYDGYDDTLVGIVNNAGAPLSSIGLSSAKDIFGFDGDGICSSGFTPWTTLGGSGYCAPQTSVKAHDPSDPGTDYQGPDNTWSNVSTDKTSGTVDFTSALGGNGGSTFFSLENDLSGCADTSCVNIPDGTLTINKVDGNQKALDGATFTVYTQANKGGTATPCVATGGKCELTGVKAGKYWVDETTTPAGYQTAAEQTVLVLGNDASLTFVDALIPTAPTTATTTTTTTTTTVAPTTAVSGATTVHTGESFAGSEPYVLAVVGAGFGLMGFGLLRRRSARAARR
jgi:hypothetical protein